MRRKRYWALALVGCIAVGVLSTRISPENFDQIEKIEKLGSKKEESARQPASSGEPLPVEATNNEESQKTTTGALCRFDELPGEGLKESQVTAREWKEVMGAFHRSKKDLIQWLNHSSGKLSQSLHSKMVHEMEELRIQRPPVPEENELNWRGVVLLSRDPAGKPIVRMGAGFLKQFQKDQARASFELTRVMAQLWSPCGKLVHGTEGTPWDETLRCLGMSAEKACDPSVHLESVWAVTSVLASQVRSPGCVLPAFEDNPHWAKACLKRFAAKKFRLPAQSAAEGVSR